MNLRIKILELQRQVSLLQRKAVTAKYQHTRERYQAVAAAKRQHLRDLVKLEKFQQTKSESN